MMYNYLVILEKTGTGYSAHVPDLPGCITVGETKEETMKHMQKAIQLHIEGMKEDGLDIPESNTEALRVSVQ
ncbi:type II toxin-antitoxin system HicB family antitoxin [Catalinimonas niigatensis]|uniref:type II toxin-antitoxin system HicB family antitoxin n=1 Tax=Catalinimonas niigatensis TaxID=1397264 RepID=UPI002665F26D|nr:type II toxin-antitoxin system HicB family antitoxin [Catalinimonas niigatensis]WPP53565.1 type II toxin-antitoxin system HicB family antitoxin [Catalinimonas niigatensis]